MSGASRPRSAPTASTTASKDARSVSTDRSPGFEPPTSQPVTNRVPSSRSCASRRSRTFFSILNSGMPYRSRPPSRSSRSYTVTSWPARVSCCAAASPAGPEPTTATVLPDDTIACRGRIRSFSHDTSAIASSTRLIATAPPDVRRDRQHARRLARRRAQLPGELREVVGGVQAVAGRRPVADPHQVVPLRDQVPERAAGGTRVTERDPAVHAPRRLRANLLVPLGRRPGRRTPRASRRAGPPWAASAPLARRASENHWGQPREASMTASSMSRPSAAASRIASSTRW